MMAGLWTFLSEHVPWLVPIIQLIWIALSVFLIGALIQANVAWYRRTTTVAAGGLEDFTHLTLRTKRWLLAADLIGIPAFALMLSAFPITMMAVVQAVAKVFFVMMTASTTCLLMALEPNSALVKGRYLNESHARVWRFCGFFALPGFVLYGLGSLFSSNLVSEIALACASLSGLCAFVYLFVATPLVQLRRRDTPSTRPQDVQHAH